MSGKLAFDHRIGLLQPSFAANAYNEEVPSYSTAATVWAARRDVSAGESYRAAQVSAQISARFTVRYSADTAAVDPTYRIVLENGLTYDVTGVRETERNRYIEIDCVARAD